jgi:murein DD-endopeptidase MepM/ murein hydrolase activator NlpD
MSIGPRRAAPSLLVLLLAFAALTAAGGRQPVQASDPSTVNEAIAQQQQLETELAQQRAQLATLRRQQAALTASLSQLTGDLDRVGLQLEAAQHQLELVTAALEQSRAELKRYETRIARLESDLREIATDIQVTRVELTEREALLQDHLRSAYEQSQTSILEVLLSTDSFSEASSRLDYMLTLSEEDHDLAEEIRATRERLKIRQQTLRDGRATLIDLRAAAAERTAQLDVQQREVDAARQKLAAYQARLVALQDEQRAQLAAAIRNEQATGEAIAAHEQELAAQAALVERLKAEADKLDIAYHGRFEWPERGDFVVTQEFGRTSFSPYHTGLDMSYHTPRCGGPIYAAADGTVLADGRPNLAYGDTAIGVVIGHSQRLQTWYWHLSNEVVAVGQQVATGDVIGYEGATGIATGCHLHFQVMFDDQPVNPRNYLP